MIGTWLSQALTDQLWQLHQIELPAPQARNQHMLYVCFGCAVAARWGRCEHMYSFMLENGDINRCQIPQPKPKGRPRTRTKAQAQPLQIVRRYPLDSSWSNTGTARPAQSSVRSRVWSVCSYHDCSGCDPSNAGDPSAPGLHCDFWDAAEWSMVPHANPTSETLSFVALGLVSAYYRRIRQSLRPPAAKERGVPHHDPARQCWICYMPQNWHSEARFVWSFRGMWLRLY